MSSDKTYSKKSIIFLCSMVYFVSYFSRKDFAAAMAGMITDGAISRANAGLVGTMLFAFYGVGQLISGYLGDKISPKHLIIIGLSSTAICNAAMPYLPDAGMIVIWGLNGLAQAMLWPPIVKILSTYLDHKTYVTAHLVVTSSAHFATVLLYAYVPLCLTFMSWQTVFVTASVLAVCSIVIFTVAMSLLIPKGSKREEVSDSAVEESTVTRSDEKIMTVLKRSGIFTVFVCIVVLGFLRDGIESWLPMLYSEAFGKDVSESTLVSIALPIFSIISISVVTILYRKQILGNEVSGSIVLFGISLVLAVPLVFFLSMDGVFFRVAALFITAFICGAMHGVNFLLISCLPGRFARVGRSATVSGVCNSCVYVGAAISTYGIALVSERMGWSVTAATWCGILAVGIIFALLSYKRYTAMLDQNEN
jgi:OPA family glycerol-3-phosphate transporter-like MFS transporter